MNKLIFADIDGTLVRASLERWFLKYLRNNRHASLHQIAWNGLRLSLRSPFSPFYRFKLAYIAGKSVERVHALYLDCWKTVIQEALFDPMIDGLNALSEMGADVVLLSGTPEPFAEPFRGLMPVRDLICAKPEIREGVYVGGLTEHHPRGVHKVTAAERWMRVHDIRWDEVIVLGDHPLDRDVLEKAGRAIAVNPKPGLARIAEMAGWEIVNAMDPHWWKSLPPFILP